LAAALRDDLDYPTRAEYETALKDDIDGKLNNISLEGVNMINNITWGVECVFSV